MTIRMGLAALIPACLGAPPAQAATIHAALCGGGSIDLPVSGPQLPGVPGAPCCAKGCRSGAPRKRFDRTQ